MKLGNIIKKRTKTKHHLQDNDKSDARLFQEEAKGDNNVKRLSNETEQSSEISPIIVKNKNNLIRNESKSNTEANNAIYEKTPEQVPKNEILKLTQEFSLTKNFYVPTDFDQFNELTSKASNRLEKFSLPEISELLEYRPNVDNSDPFSSENFANLKTSEALIVIMHCIKNYCFETY